MPIKIIPYSKQSIDEDDIKRVVDVLKSDFITQGPSIRQFEDAIASYCKAKYAVAFNSGTSALHAACFASGLTHGDEFITSPISFVASSNAGIYVGGVPVFADINPNTGNIDPVDVRKKITKRTKLVIPVHYAGQPADMNSIAEIATQFGLSVIEDACHAFGASYNNIPIGNCNLSDMAVFSFHPVKTITTGEGGAVVTNNEHKHKQLILFRNHGITRENFLYEPHGDWYYEMQTIGYNYRITDLQAMLGISQLKKTNSFVSKRKSIAEYYRNQFSEIKDISLIPENPSTLSSHHLFPILLKNSANRKKVFNKLKEKGLGVQIHYIPIYLQPYYRQLGYCPGICPLAEDFYSKEISIPIFPSMSDEEIYYCADTLKIVLQDALL